MFGLKLGFSQGPPEGKKIIDSPNWRISRKIINISVSKGPTKT
jgi:hypothetical protein